MLRVDKLTTFIIPIVSKSWSLNLFKPSAPVRACIRVALPEQTDCNVSVIAVQQGTSS
jgi:hypothetical protein